MSSPPTGVIFNEAIAQPLSSIGTIQPGAYYQFYLTGTTTLTNVYADGALTSPLSQTPGTGATTANAAGKMPQAIYLNPATTYRYKLFTSLGTLIEDIDPYIPISPPTQAQVGLALYPQTAAEIAASVTPANYAYPELTLERYGGSSSSSASINNTSLSNAITVASSKGGGVIQLQGLGTWQFSNSFTIPAYTTLQGQGYGTIVNYTGSGSFLTINSTSSRSGLAYMQVIGTSQTGVGLTLGDISGNSGFSKIVGVLFSKWATALRMGGGTWITFEKCEFGNAAGNTLGVITNNVGVDFNYFGSQNYSSALRFQDCVISNNANAGVQATSVPITMNQVSWINCTVQNNCQSATGNPQFYMSNVLGFSIDNMYMEYVLGGTAPDALRSDNLNGGRIDSIYINTAANGIKDRGGGSMNQVDINRPYFNGIVTAAISCASEHDVIVRAPQSLGGGTVTLTGTGCAYLPAGSALSSWPTNESGFSPAIAFGTSGSITQTVQGATYSQVGNVVTVNFRINWSAISSPTGAVSITGFPVAPKNSGPDACLTVSYFSGLTVAAGTLGVFLGNNTTTGTIYNIQTTTAALQGSAFASSGAIIVSGSYQV
jgi:hypothetical protein